MGDTITVKYEQFTTELDDTGYMPCRDSAERESFLWMLTLELEPERIGAQPWHRDADGRHVGEG